VSNYLVRENISEKVHAELAAYPELMRVLMHYRGIDTKEKAEVFLNPVYERDIHDPFLLKDMDKAVERILRAVENNERILIYSDYDADGIPAAVVLSDFFKLIKYDNVEVYIPHRHNEGYGLHIEAIETFIDKKIKLMITLDCGIVDHAEVVHAKELGIDVIVTDHHVAGETIPDAYAVINPKRKDCEYPYDMLCGAGVGFKLVQALLLTLRKSHATEYVKGVEGGDATRAMHDEAAHPSTARSELKDGQEKWLLDMVGLATLSDMVPLTGENRALAHYGIKVLRKSRRPGFNKLLAIMNVNKQYLTEDDVGFMITPRINAASRMGVPTDAFKLLSTDDIDQGNELAKHLDTINKERKTLVGTTVKEIKKIISEREEHFKEKKVIVLGNPTWRPALLGLAANTIAEEHNKPVFLWGREEGKDIKGSCRSDGVTHLVKLMEYAKSHFSEFGGHAFSGGYAVHAEKVHTLEDVLNEAFLTLGNQVSVQEPKYIDAKLSLDDVTWQLANSVEKLAPFGMENPKPVFLFENLKPIDVKMFGKAKDHLELSFLNSSGRKVKAIGFFMTPESFTCVPKQGIPMNLVATLEKSYFGFNPELRLRIVDCL
jgi:single-stranded-DNA-specific exonuclease